MKKLKLAIILETTKINYPLYEFIEYISKNTIYERPILIINRLGQNNKIKKINKLNYFLNKFLISIIISIENLLILKSCPKFLKIFDVKNLENIKVLCLRNDFKNLINKNKSNIYDFKSLKNENIDLIISSKSNLLNDEILEVSKIGAIIFDSFNNLEDQTNLLGLSEITKRENTVNIDILACTKTITKFEILISGKICPKPTWILTRLFVYKKSIFFLKKFIDNIAVNRKLPKSINARSLDYLQKDNFTAKTKMIIEYMIFTLLKKTIISILNKIRGKKVNRWSIAYSNSKPLTKSFSRFKEVLNPKARFLADPFLFSSNGKTYIFVEDYFFDENKGKISVIDITNGIEKFLGVVLEEEFHLSFPYVFKDSNKIYMIPETHESNEIRLYECINFPMKWKYKCTLMNKVTAADTILIKKNKIWYMLTNICSAGINDHCSELHIFYSDNLFSNDWKPIKTGNPVIFNSLKARNGGIFEREGKVYRVNQVQSLNEYGYAFAINIIKIIDKNLFVEEEIKRVNPDFLPEISGTHHFNSNNKFSVFDYHRVLALDKILKEF